MQYQCAHTPASPAMQVRVFFSERMSRLVRSQDAMCSPDMWLEPGLDTLTIMLGRAG